MKKKIIILILFTLGFYGCTNAEQTTNKPKYSATEMILGTILATAMYNNDIPTSFGESKTKTSVDRNTTQKIETSMGDGGSMTTRTVTKTTEKTKSKRVSYKFGM